MKSFWKSKTVWGGALLALAGLITGIGQLLLGEIQAEGLILSIMAFLKGVWDVYNRFNTTQPIN